jgi:hypothetical protein
MARNSCSGGVTVKTVAAALLAEILSSRLNLWKRSGRKGRWRDGNGRECLENLSIARHQRDL